MRRLIYAVSIVLITVATVVTVAHGMGSPKPRFTEVRGGTLSNAWYRASYQVSPDLTRRICGPLDLPWGNEYWQETAAPF